MCFSIQTVFLLLLSVGNVCPSVDVNWLTRVVDAVRTEYKIKQQFCLAANIPLTADEQKLQEILQKYKYDSISDHIETGAAFVGDDLIIAKVIGGPRHAEGSVLTKKNLEKLRMNSYSNFLFIYSYLSACSKCTTPRIKYNVVDVLSEYVNRWEGSAFVFTKVYDQPNNMSPIPRTELVDSICNLGDAMQGLKNIYRCDKMNNILECSSCSTNARISEVCLNNNALAGQQAVDSCGSDSNNNWSNRKSSTSRDINKYGSPKRRDKDGSSPFRGRSKENLVGKDSWRTRSRSRSPSRERSRNSSSRG